MKTCRVCGFEKPVNDFYRYSKNDDVRRQNICKICCGKRYREYFIPVKDEKGKTQAESHRY